MSNAHLSFQTRLFQSNALTRGSLKIPQGHRFVPLGPRARASDSRLEPKRARARARTQASKMVTVTELDTALRNFSLKAERLLFVLVPCPLNGQVQVCYQVI